MSYEDKAPEIQHLMQSIAPNKIHGGTCAFCPNKITGREDFNDELSWKEYQISGLCQKCQDEVWG